MFIDTEKRKLISKHLENWDGLKKSSIQHYYETGKISGSFLIALEELLEEYAQSKDNRIMKDKN